MLEFLTIHTSDRTTHKRCLRKWGCSSPWRKNLAPTGRQNSNLWLGSGFHFSLEDYHGYNHFGIPQEALAAYYDVFDPNELPMDASELVELGMSLLDYYLRWEKRHEQFKTVWINGMPLVEVAFTLELEELSKVAREMKVAEKVFYHGTLDRVVEDKDGKWWIEDYKTAATIDIKKQALDPQISAYLWAAEQYFNKDIEGMLYTQFAKDTPRPLKQTTQGLSADKRQKTTYWEAREQILATYGTIPGKYIEFMNMLAELESDEGDRFIRRDKVYRNDEAKENTYHHIIQEGLDMLKHATVPFEHLYPNPTRDCSWDCPFRAACIALEEGADWEYLLDIGFEERNRTEEGEIQEWKQKLQRKHQMRINQLQTNSYLLLQLLNP